MGRWKITAGHLQLLMLIALSVDMAQLTSRSHTHQMCSDDEYYDADRDTFLDMIAESKCQLNQICSTNVRGCTASDTSPTSDESISSDRILVSEPTQLIPGLVKSSWLVPVVICCVLLFVTVLYIGWRILQTEEAMPLTPVTVSACCSTYMMGSGGSSNDDLISSTTNGDGDVYFSKGDRTLTVQGNSRDSLPSRFGRYWKKHKLYDLVITCRQQKFEVHRDILSGLSDYFENAISNKLHNDNLIMDYDPGCMNKCLEYLYTGRVEVDRYLVGTVASMAKILEIPHLYNTCRAAELTDATAAADNCLDMWFVGEAIGDKDMLKRGKDAALANLDDLMEQKSFMNLSHSRLIELVSHEDLAVSYAADRLGATLLWAGHDSNARTQHLTSMLQALPLNDISRISLRQALNNPLMADHPEVCLVLQRMIENCRPKP